MTATSGIPDNGPNHKTWGGLALALLLAVTGIGWVSLGPHRRLPTLLLEEGAKHGLLFQGGDRQGGPLTTTIRNVHVSLRGNPGLAVEIGRLHIWHWPLLTPHVSIEGIKVHLNGDPVMHFGTVTKAWFSPKVTLEYRPMEMTFEHRLLGQLRLGGVVLERRGDSFAIEAARVTLGDSTWQDVRLSLEQRKSAVEVGFGDKAGQGGPQLTIFPPQPGISRWLVDLPHGPVRPLLKRLGLDPGDDFAATRAAGSLSLDIPDDGAQPVRGRVQMVVDDWPLHAPAEAGPLLGRSFALLSNVVASPDGSRWELPRAELTMPVFSLVGKGSLQLGRDKRLVLEAEGERTCQQLRGLLPPGKPLDQVRRFLEKKGSFAPKDGVRRARLEIRWNTADPTSSFRPVAYLVSECGLDPWPPNP